MSEGPYRNMSYEDAVKAMRRIYELLYPRKFHSYNPSLDEPFANFVGSRGERDATPAEFTTLYGKIGDVLERFTPILGDISYAEGETPDTIPPNKSKVILDYHGMAILNSLLEVAELGAKYINLVNKQIFYIQNNLKGQTPLANGNAIAISYVAVINNVNTEFASMYGDETLSRVKSMINKLSSGTRSGVLAKNVNVITSISEYQVGQEDVISDAFDKDFLEYFMMYLEAENKFHDSVKTKYDLNTAEIRDSERDIYRRYRANTIGNIAQNNNTGGQRKFARYVDVSGCRASCVGLCVGSCSNTCFGCSDQCAGQCTQTCADCNAACMQNCGTTCQGSCLVECIGCSIECGGGCISTCKSDCGGTCVDGCHTDCAGSCYGTSEGFVSVCSDCGSACKGTCGNSCESEAAMTPPAPDPVPPVIEIEEEAIIPEPPTGLIPLPGPQDHEKPQYQGGPSSHPDSGWVSTGGSTGYWIYTDGHGNTYRTDDRSSFMNGQTTSNYTTPWDGSPSNDQFYQIGGNSGSTSGSGSGTAWYDRGNNADGSAWHGNDR